MSEESVGAEKQSISEIDKMTLELAKSRRQLALTQVEKAVAQQEAAEIGYRYIVLQIYMKYGLTEADVIDEKGAILRGAATQNPQG